MLSLKTIRNIGPKAEDKQNVFDKVASKVASVDDLAARKIQQSLDWTIDITKEDGVPKQSHEWLMKNSTIYKSTIEAVTDTWNENTFVGKVKFYLDLDDKARREEFNKLNTQAIHAEERKAQF